MGESTMTFVKFHWLRICNHFLNQFYSVVSRVYVYCIDLYHLLWLAHDYVENGWGQTTMQGQLTVSIHLSSESFNIMISGHILP